VPSRWRLFPSIGGTGRRKSNGQQIFGRQRFKTQVAYQSVIGAKLHTGDALRCCQHLNVQLPNVGVSYAASTGRITRVGTDLDHNSCEGAPTQVTLTTQAQRPGRLQQ
jgi:hypothetical protein